MKTFKLLLADDKCCVQFDSILHALLKYIVGSTEQGVPVVCSLVGVSPQCAQVLLLVKIRTMQKRPCRV